jgi:hypothetical protein
MKKGYLVKHGWSEDVVAFFYEKEEAERFGERCMYPSGGGYFLEECNLDEIDLEELLANNKFKKE